MRKNLLLAAALVAPTMLSGCIAQEGVPVPGQAGFPPLAVADVAMVETDSLNNSLAALANDIDLSGTGLTITLVTVDQVLPPAAGATASTDGNSVTFTPPAGFTGVVTLNYTISDGTGATSSAAIAVSVLPVALPPAALPDAATVTQDSGPTDIDVLANDVDFAGGGLTLTAATITTSLPPGAHTVTMAGNQVRFTPAAAFVGAVLVDYTATDVNGNSATGVLTVVVSPLAVPAGPVPVPDAAVVAQDSAATDIDVLINDVDPAGGGLSLTGVTVTASVPMATHTVAINADQVRFTPAAGFVGTVVVGYTATDINGESADGVLTVVVSPLVVAPGPVPVPDAAVVPQDSAATDIDVLINDVDPAGGGLTLSNVMAFSSVPMATHTLAINADQVRFTPEAGFVGTVVVTYTATDVNGASADGVLSIVVSPLALALGPVPVPDAATVMQDSVDNDIVVLANDVDTVGLGLSLTAVSITASVPPEGTGHTVTINGNLVRFTPEVGFAGTVVVTYTATDGNGESADGVLNITVSPLALPVGLVAIPDAATVAQDSVDNDIDVLGNDVDFAGGGLDLTGLSIFSSLPPETTGHTVIINGDLVRFTPEAGFAGIVQVQYTATDVNGLTSNGLLSIEVTPAALVIGPLALPDADTASATGGAQTYDVLANDVDPAGMGLTLTNVSITSETPPTGSGAVAIAGDLVEYTPNVAYLGIIVITYTAEDINGNTTDGELTLTVGP